MLLHSIRVLPDPLDKLVFELCGYVQNIIGIQLFARFFFAYHLLRHNFEQFHDFNNKNGFLFFVFEKKNDE